MSVSLSSLSISTQLRSSISRIQSDLVKASAESDTGRHYDVGLTLGGLTGTSLAYQLEFTAAKRQQTSNTLVNNRLETIDKVLTTVREAGDELRDALTLGLSADKLATTVTTATSAMRNLAGAMNTSLNGQYLFSGQKSNEPAFNEYVDGSAAKNMVATSFQSYLAQIGKSAADLDATEMNAYLNGDFAKLFALPENGGAWNAFSNASSTNTISQLSDSQSVESSVSANAKPLRDMTAAFVMVTDLMSQGLSAKAQDAVAQQVRDKLASASTNVTALQADIGFRQTRVDQANQVLKQKQDIMEASVDSLEGVDPQEAVMRMQQLSQQLAISYKAAGQILQLSILDYI